MSEKMEEEKPKQPEKPKLTKKELEKQQKELVFILTNIFIYSFTQIYHKYFLIFISNNNI